jgi:CzcA family heavy metal efflux pump
MRPALSRVPGVGRVEVASSDTTEIEVVVDPGRLLASGTTPGDVVTALRAANRITPVGRYSKLGLQNLVLASGLWASVDDIGSTPVVVKGRAAVRVSDLGDVVSGAPDRVSLVSGNGEPAAVVSISQQIGSNILAVRDGVEGALGDLTRSLPSGLRLAKVYDLAGFVADAMASVRDAILIGGVLAVVVLFLFLRSWRITLIAALTLPLTVVSTFLFMRLFGETVNLMSMGGLAVAIGLVVDDAVVVVENIHRHFGRGERDAVESATGELFAPVVGSTLTVVVFAPLGLLSGVVGQFFRALSITLTVSVLLSLVLALSLIPILARWAYSGAHVEERSRGLDERYERALAGAMKRPRIVLAAAACLALAALLLYSRVGTGFLPRMDEGGFVIDYRSAPGSALPETDRQVRLVEAIVKSTPEVASFSRRTGAELGLFATQPNKGDVLVRLKPRGQRSRSADAVIDELRPKVGKAVPGLDVEFVQLLQDMIGDLEGQPSPIEVKVFGDDVAQLASIAETIEARLGKIQGVVDVVGQESGSPEVTWQVDAVAAGRLGLTVEDVSRQLQTAWLGEVATDLRLFDRTIPVRVRYPDALRFDPQRLAETTVRGADGKVVPIGGLARASASGSAPVLQRENLRQMVLVTARLEGRDLGSAVAEIQKSLAGLPLPVGYTTEIGGQYESERQAFQELLQVLAIASALVFGILLVEFRAFTPAILIVAAAPLSFVGSLLMLLITGTELNVSSAMGFILLVGLVVKNGIVMLDYAHHLHERGTGFAEAVAEAARVRLRPILMTTLCTLFGLLPLALGLGAGAELQKPLALVVIGGLSLSTLVTLFAVPTAYVAIRGRGSDAEA